MTSVHPQSIRAILKVTSTDFAQVPCISADLLVLSALHEVSQSVLSPALITLQCLCGTGWLCDCLITPGGKYITWDLFTRFANHTTPNLCHTYKFSGVEHSVTAVLKYVAISNKFRHRQYITYGLGLLLIIG